MLKGKRYVSVDGRSRYTISVINYQGTEVSDVRGAIPNMATIYRRKGGEVTHDQYTQVDRIEGHQLHITNPDRSRTFLTIHLHKNRLYVLEGVTPEGAPPAMLFEASLSILDAQGSPIRYDLDADGVRTQTAGGGQ